MKAAELNSLSDEQLVHKGLELERELMRHMMRHRLGQLENTSVLAKTRRDIARVATFVTRREHVAALDKGTLTAQHRGTFVPAAPAAGQADAGAGFLSGMLDKSEAAE
jgi:ribosomal protein L29